MLNEKKMSDRLARLAKVGRCEKCAAGFAPSRRGFHGKPSMTAGAKFERDSASVCGNITACPKCADGLDDGVVCSGCFRRGIDGRDFRRLKRSKG